MAFAKNIACIYFSDKFIYRHDHLKREFARMFKWQRNALERERFIQDFQVHDVSDTDELCLFLKCLPKNILLSVLMDV